MEKRISIIIPNKNSYSYLKTCIDSITKLNYKNIEIIIVDNGSTEEDILDYYEILNKINTYKIIKCKMDFNYSKMNNMGAEHATGDFLLLLNNDTMFVDPDTIKKMLKLAEKDDTGAVGVLMLFEDNTIQHIGVTIRHQLAKHHFKYNYYKRVEEFGLNQWDNLQCDAVTGACLLIKKQLYMNIAGLNESLKIAYNDIDLCLRLRKLGLKNYCVINSYIYHFESKSRGNTDISNDIKLFNKISEFSEEITNIDFYRLLNNATLEKIINNQEFFIFGTSRAGQEAFALVYKNRLTNNFKGFIDNNSEKHNSILNNYRIYNPNILTNNSKVIVASSFADQISLQLKKMGIKDENVLFIN